VQRELKEETGFDISEFNAEPGWTTIVDGALIAQIKVLQSDQTAGALRTRILEQLAKETQPELADIGSSAVRPISHRRCRTLCRLSFRTALPAGRVGT